MLPYVYAEHTAQLYDMERAGILMIGMADEYSPGMPTYYCRHCQQQQYFISTDAVRVAAKKSFAKKQKR